MTSQEFDTFAGIDFASDESRRFADYWNSLPRQGQVPVRGDFDPTAIKDLLPGIALFEVRSPDAVIVRLAGTKMVETLGQEVTGRNYLDLWSVAARPEVGKVLAAMVEQPCGLIVTMSNRTESGSEIRNVSVGFPLWNRTGELNLLVFQANNFEIPDLHDASSDQIVEMSIIRRAFIDIGAGRPVLRD